MSTEIDLIDNNRGLDLERALVIYQDNPEVLTGRLLSSITHDAEGCKTAHMHWYRRILGYNLETQRFVVSKKGSRRLMENLDTQDREYTQEELIRLAQAEWLSVRSYDHQIF